MSSNRKITPTFIGLFIVATAYVTAAATKLLLGPWAQSITSSDPIGWLVAPAATFAATIGPTLTAVATWFAVVGTISLLVIMATKRQPQHTD